MCFILLKNHYFYGTSYWYWNFILQNVVYSDLMVVWTWFLIQVKYEVENFLKLKSEKGRAKGGHTSIQFFMSIKIWKIDIFEDFSSTGLFLRTHLPPLFKIFQIIKYITSTSFCTKNETHKLIRSMYMLILIWGDSQAKSMIFFDYEILIFARSSHFLAKMAVLDFKALCIRM